MPRVKRLSQEEQMEARRAIQEKARQGRLVWPEALAEMRLALGFTQAEFAKTFRLTPRQVSDYEIGKTSPTVETVNRLSKAFGLCVGIVPRAKAG